jgi:hypothetical protein
MNRKSLQQLPTRAIYVIYVCACSGPSAFLWPLGGSGCRYSRSQSLPLGRQIVGRGVRILDLELRGDPLGPLDHTLACFRGNLVFLIQFLQTISRIRDDSARRPGDFARGTPRGRHDGGSTRHNESDERPDQESAGNPRSHSGPSHLSVCAVQCLFLLYVLYVVVVVLAGADTWFEGVFGFRVPPFVTVGGAGVGGGRVRMLCHFVRVLLFCVVLCCVVVWRQE